MMVISYKKRNRTSIIGINVTPIIFTALRCRQLREGCRWRHSGASRRSAVVEYDDSASFHRLMLFDFSEADN
jgi:hypothetical protein